MFGRKGKKGNYAYAVTKVKAKKGKLLDNEAYSKMLMMSLPEISRYIGELEYKKEMAELAGKIGGIDLIEHATYLSMADLFSTILQSTAGELYDMVSSYLTKWDMWNLKVILRGKVYGADVNSIKEDLVPAGNLNSAKLEGLLSLDTDKDIIEEFCRLEHIDMPADVVNAYRADGHLRAIEDYLDTQYYDRLLRSIDPTSPPKRLFMDFIRTDIDTVNLETILMLKAEGIRGDDAMKFFVPGGKEIDRKLATQLANAESLSAAANDLTQLEFYDDIKEALEAGSGSLKDIVAGMKRYRVRKAKKFSGKNPLSVIPIIDFMIHKEIEVENIRIIARGIESGIDRDIIKGLLVVV